MERMKDLTQQYVEQLENMVKDLREKNEKQYKTIESLYENVKYFDHRLCDIDSKLISKQEENKKLKEENKKLREELSAYDREYFDEDKKAENIFMEEDTLQELRDLGEI